MSVHVRCWRSVEKLTRTRYGREKAVAEMKRVRKRSAEGSVGKQMGPRVAPEL